VSKQITDIELAEIVTMLLTTDYIDDAAAFSEFMGDVAKLVCYYCGGEVLHPASKFTSEWLVGIHANDCLPEGENVWSKYDLEGEL